MEQKLLHKYEKEKNEWAKRFLNQKREFSNKYNDLLNENLTLQQKIQEYQEKIEENTNENNVDNAFSSMKNNIQSIDRLLLNLNKEQVP